MVAMTTSCVGLTTPSTQQKDIRMVATAKSAWRKLRCLRGLVLTSWRNNLRQQLEKLKKRNLLKLITNFLTPLFMF